MFPKKLKRSGELYKKAAKLEEQFEKEWALQNDPAGPSSQPAAQQSAEGICLTYYGFAWFKSIKKSTNISFYCLIVDVAMNEPCEGPVASMEEEYLDENNTDDERASDEGSIHNEDTDGEEYLEEEYL